MDYAYYDENEDYDAPALRSHMHAAHYNDGEDDYYMDEDSNEMKSPMEYLWDAYEDCVKPSLTQITDYVLIIVVSGLIFRLIRYTLNRRAYIWTPAGLHLSSFICGLAVLYLTQQSQLTIAILLLQLLTYALLYCMRMLHVRYLGTMMAFVTIGTQFVYELSWRHPDAWQRIRGIQMVAIMKVISLAYDIEIMNAKEQTAPNLLAYLGYIFCPATCALGPWVSYQSYLASLGRGNAKERPWKWIMQTLLNILCALCFLIVSNCYAPVFGSITRRRGLMTVWIGYYADALGVRCSHYFISFLAQAGVCAAGCVSLNPNNESWLFGPIVITRPWLIEWPRSLSSLVRSWNTPMHYWLKKYVYQAALKRFDSNIAIALLCTYLVSALLHGLHLHIYLVLLSLGAFAYVESSLRARLAFIFNACIGSNPCIGGNKKMHCSYNACLTKSRNARPTWTWLVPVINSVFSLVTIFNLAYLGVMLATDESETNESPLPIIWKWMQVDYLNHYIALAAFILYLFIS